MIGRKPSSIMSCNVLKRLQTELIAPPNMYIKMTLKIIAALMFSAAAAWVSPIEESAGSLGIYTGIITLVVSTFFVSSNTIF